MSVKTKRFDLWLLLPVFIPLGLLFILLRDISLDSLTITHLLAWLICLFIFVLSDLLAGGLEGGLWAGYLTFTLTVVWLGIGFTPALLLVIAGSMGGILLRLLKLPRFYTTPFELQHSLTIGFGRIIILSGVLLVQAGIFALLDGQIPLFAIGFRDVAILGLTLLAGLVASQVIGLLLMRRESITGRLFWSSGQRHRILQELLLLILAPLVAMFLHASGILPFIIVMIVMGLQAFRYQQVQSSQQRLLQKIDQLSALDQISREIVSSLEIDDVLTTIYEYVRKIVVVSKYYVALYDADRKSLQFPLVVEDGKKIHWSSISLKTTHLAAQVIEKRQVLYIHDDYRLEDQPLPEQYTFFLGLPLAAGEKVIGALCFVSDTAQKITDDEISTLKMVANQAGLSIRNAILYNQSMEMSRNLARINNFVQGIVFSTDISVVMRSACEVAIQIAKADRVAIFYVDDGQQYLKLTHSINLPSEHQAWLVAHQYRAADFKKLPLIITDVHASEFSELQNEAAVGGYRSQAIIPMSSGNTYMGMIMLYFDYPHYYQDTELELLETMAYQLTAALDNAELVKTLEAYAAEQAQLVDLSRTSTATLDVSQIIESVLSLLQQMMLVEHVYVGLSDTLAQEVVIHGTTLSDPPPRLPLTSFPEANKVSTVPHFYTLDDLAEEVKQFAIGEGDQSLVIAPMKANNEPIGLIILGTPAKFGEAEVRLLELAANQIAIQIHHAQQYGYVQNALDRRLGQLSLLEEIAQQISSALNVDHLIGNVLDAAVRATQADMVALALVTDAGDFRIIGQELINGVWEERQIKRTQNAGLMGRVKLTKQMVIIPNNQDAADYLSTLTKGKYQSSLVVPLLKDDEVIGVLDLESVQRNFFKEEHAEFIKSLAGHAVISIQNAHLLQERQRQIDTLISLRQLSLKVSSNTDRRAVVNEILRTVLKIIEGDSAVMFHVEEDVPHELTLVGNLKRTDTGFSSVRTALPEVILNCAVETGETQIVYDTATDNNFKAPAEYASLVVAPIKHGNRVQEVLAITFTHQSTQLDDELSILELLLIQAAGHLENTALYERVIAGNNRLRAFLDSSSDGIILLDANGNLVQANLSAETLLGIDFTDIIGQNFANYLLKTMEYEDSANDMSESLKNMARILRLEPERIIRRQLELRRRNQPLYIEEVSSPVLDGHNQIMGRLLVLRDVTEERLLADYRNEITNMVVHDLRSPLSAIFSGLTYTKTMIEDPEGVPPPDMLNALMDVALSSTNHLLTLVDSLLDIAKLETRSMPLKREVGSVQNMIEEASESMKTLFQEGDLSFVTQIPDDLPQVYVDEGKIRRVFQNLMDNAQRFSPQGGKVLVEAVLTESGHKVLVRVVDSGQGIPSEERDRIFEKFRQIANNQPVRGRRGSGLGLTFCKLVLEAHGERIWVESDSPLSGASFAFTLPVHLGERDETL